MATISIPLHPEEAVHLSANFAPYKKFAGTNFPVSVLAYDPNTDESAYWKFVATGYGSGNLTLTLYWYADNASTGTCVWGAQIAAITADTDTQDVETKAFASANTFQDTHLGTVNQRLHVCQITISNLDNLAANDVVWLRIYRDADGTAAADSMNNDALLVMAVISYSDT